MTHEGGHIVEREALDGLPGALHDDGCTVPGPTIRGRAIVWLRIGEL